MNEVKQENPDKLIGVIDIVVIFLSIYVLGALAIDTFTKLPVEVSRLLRYIDNFVCAFFFIEFSIRFYKLRIN